MPCWDSLKDFLEIKFFEVLLKEFLGIWEENARFNRNGRIQACMKSCNNLGIPKWMTSEFVPMPNANSIGTIGTMGNGMSSSHGHHSTDGFQVSFFGKKSGSSFLCSFVWEKNSTSGVQLGETSIGKWSYRKVTWISLQGDTWGHHYYLLPFELRWCEVAKYSSPERGH